MSETPAAARAHSRDGRTFRFTAPSTLPLGPGDLVAGELDDGRVVLGQILDAGVDRDAPGDGHGVVVGALTSDGRLDRRARPPFADLPVRPADPEQLAALQTAAGAGTEVGTWLTGATGPAMLRVAGFNRHTFLCGQSGSGKTYALGVLLERLLIDTDLRVVVLDPNADFVRLGETRPGADPEDAGRVTRRPVEVLRSDRARSAEAERPLRLRFRTMPRAAQAAVLQLDPVRDHEEYSAFLRFMDRLDVSDARDLLEGLDVGDAGERKLARRGRNLGLDQWEAFARQGDSAADVVTGGTGVTVLDLGGFGTQAEPVTAALEVLEELWTQRESRVPTLVVLDEAHNLAGTHPASPAAERLLERIVQIAAEGRKYGLWLLLSTQRPSKIHPQVLSQCDNLVVMRMNSPADVGELGRVFGFVPPGMLNTVTSFLQGEMLVAGPVAPVPMIAQVRERLTVEGGSDVAVPMTSAAD